MAFIGDTPPSSEPHGGKIVVLNGFPGAGKLTILKQLKERLPADTTCLMDNHLLIDPVTAIIPDRNDEHYELRRSIRTPIFEKLGQRARDGHTILMTACLVKDSREDVRVFCEYVNMSHTNRVRIFWINVHCDFDILKGRIISPERCREGKTKLTDVTVLEKLVREHRLIALWPMPPGPTGNVAETLDVSGPVEQSVSRLLGILYLPQHVEEA